MWSTGRPNDWDGPEAEDSRRLKSPTSRKKCGKWGTQTLLFPRRGPPAYLEPSRSITLSPPSSDNRKTIVCRGLASHNERSS
jgi:hypothetical protein